MADIKLSPWLLQAVQNGEAVLFLGAGASIGARSEDGKAPLMGDALRDLLSDTFLDGKRKDWSLARVADYAETISSQSEVQALIKSQFEGLEPADFHCLIPKFRWHSIVTTNYDFIIERAYEKTPERLQKLAPIVRDGDRFSQKIKDPDLVPYLKLHGCLSVINDERLPLILTSEQYAKYETDRKRLFSHLKEWGREHPIIFCGYEIADPNIQYILFDLADMGLKRPRYALVKPSIDELDELVWQGRRFDTVSADFKSFLKYLDNEVPGHARILSALRDRASISVTRWFTSHSRPSDNLVTYLSNELEHVYEGMPIEGLKPEDFYRGLVDGWGIFHQNLDVRRRVTDDIVANWLLDEDDEKTVRCVLLKGHAGSGKNITLKRAAWEAAHDYDKLVFYLKEGGVLRKNLIHELYRLIGQRMTLFLSDVTKVLPEVLDLIKFARNNQVRLTLIFGARTNEWNVIGEKLAPELDAEYDLRDLSEKEIPLLLEKLERHRCLGYLATLTPEQRFELFKLNAERQLLVALHEATSGKSFEELVFDEYTNIVPSEARILYLDICTLHRLGAPVRAGLISRISGISFKYFHEEFLKPLEHVVRAFGDGATRDYAYRSRHPLIAKFVFQQVLRTPAERADQIIRMMKYMNVDYSCDEEAFGHLIKGRELAELFADRHLADQIYQVAEETGAPLAHVYHQEAVFELNHPHGSTRRAIDALNDAEKHVRNGSESLAHTRAMTLRKMAQQATTSLEKDKYRKDSKSILKKQLQAATDSYPFVGLGQIILDEIREKQEELAASEFKDSDEQMRARLLADLIGEAEDVLSRGLDNSPDDRFLLSLQADLAKILNDTPSMVRALEKVFKTTPRSDDIAVRLAQHYFRAGRTSDAETVLKKCLEHNPDSKRVHLQLAKFKIEEGEETHKDTISYHLKRSFTEGDTNHNAQTLCARHEFLYGDRNNAERIFQSLKTRRFDPRYRNQAWGEVKTSEGGLREFRGWVEERFDSYCFVNLPDLEYSVFIHYTNFDHHEWESLSRNTGVLCNVAFTVRGPCGINARALS